MDLLTHIVSGAAAGTLAAHFSKRRAVGRGTIVVAGALGGMLPDVDAISLWSQFDATIGRLLHLPYPGAEIYSGRLWYSHHGFFHSLAAGLLIAALIGTIAWFSGKKRRVPWGVIAAFTAGFLIHLIEDMPTPASTWGGVRLWWPSPHYVGGGGQIWWWNNYDLLLIAFAVMVVNGALLAIRKTKYVALGLFALGAVAMTVQISSRDDDYAYSGHTPRYAELEAASKAQQRAILGERLYRTMERLDAWLPIYF